MPDRYSYSSPSSQGNDPWFRVGQIYVTTTVGVIGIGLISMIIWAMESASRPISSRLWLESSDGFGARGVVDGQIWRLITWPFANEPDFWTVILFAVLYMLGSQLENLMGRKPFMFFLIAITVVPAIAVTVFEVLLADFFGFSTGLRLTELGILVAFAAQYPHARFWPGIPSYGIVAVILFIDYLQILDNRDEFEFVLLTGVIVTSLVALRSFGHAQELPWIPSIRLPATVTGTSTTPPRPARNRRRGRGRARGNLSAVPSPSPTDPLADLEIDTLLDQVAEHGLGSLTKDQRKRLEDHSKRLRKRRDD